MGGTGRSGKGPGVEPIQLSPGEVEVARTTAALLTGGVSMVGGDLVLTNRRVVFTPLRPVRALFGWARKIRAESTDASAITDVVVGRAKPSLIKPPSLVVHRSVGGPIEFGISASRFTPMVSKKNEVARDNFLQLAKKTLSL